MGNHSRRSGNSFSPILTVVLLVATGVFAVVSLAGDEQAREDVSRAVPSTLPGTVPPGGRLPAEEECAARIPRSAERIPENQTANNTNAFDDGLPLAGSQLAHYGGDYEFRVTGNFTGTTDEIIEWGACKWGFDPDTVKAQAVVESSWRQSMLGDCDRGGRTQPETHDCQSVGLLQVKGADIPPTHPGTWPDAWTSTAFNVDYTLAIRRACFEGKEDWLNEKYTPSGKVYAAGDEWGCIGRWFSGDWYGYSAEDYIRKVKEAFVARTWNS